MHPLEMSIHRRNTKAFIDADPMTLVLTPTPLVRTASGGYKRAEQPSREAQVFRLIPSTKTQDNLKSAKSSTGRVVQIEFVLLGEWNCVMEQWDRFEFDGDLYELPTPIRPLHTTESIYERKADVVRVVDEDA
jgi:hypothetical protein